MPVSMGSLHMWKLLGLWVGDGTELVWVRRMILYLCPEHCKISVVSHKVHSPAAQETTPVSLFFLVFFFFLLIMQLICIYWKNLEN